MAERNHMTECYSCNNLRNVPGNCHIKCAKPDQELQFNPHGIRNGWVIYPVLFDPVWKMNNCKNFEEKKP